MHETQMCVFTLASAGFTSCTEAILGVAVAEKFLWTFLELRWYATAAQLPQLLED
jgi:hypothetical protein